MAEYTIDKIEYDGNVYKLQDGISGYITTETDPTVPAWAKASTKPSYTASEVGALPDTITIPEATTAINDNNYIYNGQTVDSMISGVGMANATNLLTSRNDTYIALRSSSSNPFLGLKCGNNLWYAQAVDNYFYFGPTSAKAMRLDQNGNALFVGTVQANGNLTLYTSSGNSPGIIFQRGSLTDNYNDWKIYDKSGYLYFAQRGSGSSDFGDVGYIDTGGVIRNLTIPWGSVTGKPTIPEGVSPYTGTISAVSTTASNGTSDAFARGDHVHNLTLETLDSTLVYNLGVIYPNNMIFEVSSAAFSAIKAMWDTGFCIIRADINSDAVVYAIKERLISYNDTTLYAFIGVEASMGNQGLETGKHLFGISSSGFGLYAYVSDWNQDDTETVFNTQLAHLNISSSTTGITASTDATKTTLGTAGSVTGVQSSTTTASKVTLSGSNSFGASVNNHVLSFSHSAQTVSASDVTVPIKNTSATSIPNVSVASATVTITDPGHTHQLGN